MNKRNVFIFWGLMDLAYLLAFLHWSLKRDRIPFYDDFTSVIRITAEYGGKVPVMLFAISLLLSLSIMLTMVMFFTQHRFVSTVAYLQTPFRLFMVVPSLTVMPWLADYFEWKQLLLLFSLLGASEILKIASLWWIGRRELKALLESN